jgi:hypothetical protein
LRKDHSGLIYLFEQPTLNTRKTRWLEFLSEYEFDIKKIKGKESKVDGALSIRVHEMHSTNISMYMKDLKDIFLEAVTIYQHYVHVK